MRQRIDGRATLLAVTLALAFLAGGLGAAEPSADPAKLAQVLGKGGADHWTIAPAGFALSDEPAFVAPVGTGATLESKNSQTAPSEFVFAFRLKPVKGGSASVNFQLACAERPDKTQQALSFSVT